MACKDDIGKPLGPMQTVDWQLAGCLPEAQAERCVICIPKLGRRDKKPGSVESRLIAEVARFPAFFPKGHGARCIWKCWS